MFLGHVALGLAAKRVTPRVSLAVLLLAAQFADTLWPVLVGLGVEHVRIDPGNTAFMPLDFVGYPYSHSLVLLSLWGVLFAWIYGRMARSDRAFLVIAALVVSHWLLDFITHSADMPLYPGSATFGLGLWNSIPATLAIELPMYGAGVWLYATATRARDRVGRRAFAGLIGFLVVAYVANLGGPPPSVLVPWIAAIVGTIVLTAWSWWVDRHREPVVGSR